MRSSGSVHIKYQCTVKYSDGIGVTPIEYQLLGLWTFKYHFGHSVGHYLDYYTSYKYHMAMLMLLIER